MDRVLAVCTKLGLDEQTLKMVTSTNVQLPWGEVLSQTQRCLLNLARAFIANPEIMCMHKPTLAFDAPTTKNIMHIMKEFAHAKGIEEDPSTAYMRRRRTCMITCSKQICMEVADIVYHVSSSRGITKMQLK